MIRCDNVTTGRGVTPGADFVRRIRRKGLTPEYGEEGRFGGRDPITKLSGGEGTRRRESGREFCCTHLGRGTGEG